MHYLQRDPERLHGLFHVIKSLDKAINHHENWLGALFRQLVCNEIASDTIDTRDDAHHLCRFGQWYDSVDDPFLLEEPLFQRIGRIHQQMHDAARKVIVARDEQGSLNGAHYDAFTELTMAFKLEIRNLQFELLNRLCTVDHLTGLWNRHSMHFRIAQERERMHRSGHPACIALMDVDHFKSINDRFGHPVGDKVLQELATFFALNIRKYDAMFRYGGEEFLLCLPDTSIEDARIIMDRLREKLSQSALIISPEQEITITISIGLTTLSPDKSIDDTIQEADHALLCAKANGRNRVCAWDEESHP